MEPTIEETMIDKLSLPENASPAAQSVVLGELLDVVKKLRTDFALLMAEIEDLKVQPVENPYEPATKAEDVIQGETATGEWVRIGKVWKDPQGYIRNQSEYEDYLRTQENQTTSAEDTTQSEEQASDETTPETDGTESETAE